MKAQSEPPSIEDRTLLERRSDVRYRVLDGQAVVVVQESWEAVVLNELGTRILEMIDGRTTVEELLKQLAASYEVNRDELRRDVLSYLTDLVKAGILKTIESPRSAP